MIRSLFLLLVLLSSGAHAELNRWVDADGNVHYSDQPPPASAKEKSQLRAKSSPDSEKAAAPAEGKPEGSAGEKAGKPSKRELAEKAAQQQALDEQNKANCAVAQQNLRPLQEGIRIVEIDASGERAFLDDAERQRRIEKYQQDIKQYCK